MGKVNFDSEFRGLMTSFILFLLSVFALIISSFVIFYEELSYGYDELEQTLVFVFLIIGALLFILSLLIGLITFFIHYTMTKTFLFTGLSAILISGVGCLFYGFAGYIANEQANQYGGNAMFLSP